MVTASSPLDPIVNCVILVLSFPWTYLEKNNKLRNVQRGACGTQLQVILF